MFFSQTDNIFFCRCPQLLTKKQIRNIILVFKKRHGKKSYFFNRFRVLYKLQVNSKSGSAGSFNSFPEWFVSTLIYELKHILRENHPHMQKLRKQRCVLECTCCSCRFGATQRFYARIAAEVDILLSNLVQNPAEFDSLISQHAREAVGNAWMHHLRDVDSASESLERFSAREAVAVQPALILLNHSPYFQVSAIPVAVELEDDLPCMYD